MYCSSAKYCNFVVHTDDDLHIERIVADHGEMAENIKKVHQFFKTAIAPECGVINYNQLIIIIIVYLEHSSV